MPVQTVTMAEDIYGRWHHGIPNKALSHSTTGGMENAGAANFHDADTRTSELTSLTTAALPANPTLIITLLSRRIYVKNIQSIFIHTWMSSSEIIYAFYRFYDVVYTYTLRLPLFQL